MRDAQVFQRKRGHLVGNDDVGFYVGDEIEGLAHLVDVRDRVDIFPKPLRSRGVEEPFGNVAGADDGTRNGSRGGADGSPTDDPVVNVLLFEHGNPAEVTPSARIAALSDQFLEVG